MNRSAFVNYDAESSTVSVSFSPKHNHITDAEYRVLNAVARLILGLQKGEMRRKNFDGGLVYTPAVKDSGTIL